MAGRLERDTARIEAVTNLVCAWVESQPVGVRRHVFQTFDADFDEAHFRAHAKVHPRLKCLDIEFKENLSKPGSSLLQVSLTRESQRTYRSGHALQRDKASQRASSFGLRNSRNGFNKYAAPDLLDLVVEEKSIWTQPRSVSSSRQAASVGDTDLQRAIKLSLAERHVQSNPRAPVAVGSSLAKRRCLAEAIHITEGGASSLFAASLSQTWEYLRRDRPEEIEAGQLRIAIERSLLDCALQRHHDPQQRRAADAPSPSTVLGVGVGAGMAEVRAAYKAKALAAHPDKGGDASEFVRVRTAYLQFTGADTKLEPDQERLLALPAAGCESKDFQLRNHRELVRKKFQEDGVDLSACVAAQGFVLEALGLRKWELGAANMNEKGEPMYNQCFYLSLARSYSEDTSDEVVRDAALSLKRVIEGAVLAEHPDWAGVRVGEDVQAFSDFLVYSLGTNALLSELAVAVFDSVAGTVEIYVGRYFPGRGREAEQRSNLLTIRYEPGHYTALVSELAADHSRPSLRQLRKMLEAHGVQYVQTYV